MFVPKVAITFSALAVLQLIASSALAQTCAQRGELGQTYCDANGDLVADAPTQTRDPKPIIIGLAVVDDPDATKNAFAPFIEELQRCTKRAVQLKFETSEPLVMEAMREGRAHLAYFGTGATMFAVNFAGAVPFAGKGRDSAGQAMAYRLLIVTRANEANITKLADIKGRKVAHTSQSSNSGHLAPLAILPDLGITPGKDYTIHFSGRHDKSILGVRYGFWDAAAVASDVWERMIQRGEIDPNGYRILYQSDEFPTDSIAHAHDLAPALLKDLKQCVLSFRFPPPMKKALENADRYYPLDYKRDWALVRRVAKASGQPITEKAYRAQVDKALAKK